MHALDDVPAHHMGERDMAGLTNDSCLSRPAFRGAGVLYGLSHRQPSISLSASALFIRPVKRGAEPKWSADCSLTSRLRILLRSRAVGPHDAGGLSPHGSKVWVIAPPHRVSPVWSRTGA